jgi:hypothetical protein
MEDIRCRRDDVGADPTGSSIRERGEPGPSSRYCFEIDHRAEETIGNIKLRPGASRRITCVLAAPISDRRRTLRPDARHLTSWWHRNPFLSGVHWTSGIEVGVRLISWVWVRRVLMPGRRLPIIV